MAARLAPTYNQKPGERSRPLVRRRMFVCVAASSCGSTFSCTISSGSPSHSSGITLINPAHVKHSQLSSNAQTGPRRRQWL